jgi:hypothetical protein
VNGYAEVTLLGRFDVVFHVLELLDDALDNSRVVLEQLGCKFLI